MAALIKEVYGSPNNHGSLLFVSMWATKKMLRLTKLFLPCALKKGWKAAT